VLRYMGAVSYRGWQHGKPCHAYKGRLFL